MNNNFSNNTPNYNPNSLPNLNNGMDQSFYDNMDNTMHNNMNNTHNLGMTYLTANAPNHTPVPAAAPIEHSFYSSFRYYMVFSNIPDQPWPSYSLLQQCLDKVLARDAQFCPSIDAIRHHGGAKTGDLILSFTAATTDDEVVWTSAEGVIRHQMRYWDRDRTTSGWSLVGEHRLAQ